MVHRHETQSLVNVLVGQEEIESRLSLPAQELLGLVGVSSSKGSRQMSKPDIKARSFNRSNGPLLWGKGALH